LRLPWRRRPPAPPAPPRVAKRPAAVFTIVQNEPAFLPVWCGYYARHFSADDVFILDHDSAEERTLEAMRPFNRVPVHRMHSFDHEWLRDTVERFQAFLLGSYECVLFAEVDEIVAPPPERFPGGLRELIQAFASGDAELVRCTGYEIVHDARGGEPPLDWSAPILAQRRQCRRSVSYSKPLLARRPLSWILGFHELAEGPVKLPEPSPDLLLLHLHRVDFGSCRARTLETAARKWSEVDVLKNRGGQNRITDPVEFERWFYTDFLDDLYDFQPIPDAWREIV